MILHTLRNFLEAKWRWQWLQGERLEQFQDARAKQMVAWVAQQSPFYRTHWQGRDLANWRELPTISKQDMMDSFAGFNTLGIQRETALQAALRAEQERNFVPTLAGATVGLSSGTSGSRGLFVVSPQEQAAWSGVILSRLLHRFHPGGERVAFFLRANSNLYESVRRGRWLQFRYLDLLLPKPEIIEQLNAFQPTIIVAPPSMLEQLGQALKAGVLRIAPRQIISVAEVLEPQDKTNLEAAFQLPLHQVYQATEGLLGISCSRGHLHIQEDLMVMQMESLEAGSGRPEAKLDERQVTSDKRQASHSLLPEPGTLSPEPSRFTPILTDLWRCTQPIIRYRLGDVLRVRVGRCECGSSWRVIEQHEGRLGDALEFETDWGVRKFYLEDIRQILFASPLRFTDYQVEQEVVGHLRVFLEGCSEPLEVMRRHLEQTLANIGCKLERLELHSGIPERPANIKRRRVRGMQKATSSKQ